MDRLRQRADFLAAARGPRVSRDAFTVQHRRRDDDGASRAGFTVTKKVGTSTERSRIRRRFRSLVRALAHERGDDAFGAHCDIVLVARRSALHADFGAMRDDLTSALVRLNRRRSPSAPPARV